MGKGRKAEIAPTDRYLEPNFRNVLQPLVSSCAFVIRSQ